MSISQNLKNRIKPGRTTALFFLLTQLSAHSVAQENCDTNVTVKTCLQYVDSLNTDTFHYLNYSKLFRFERKVDKYNAKIADHDDQLDHQKHVQFLSGHQTIEKIVHYFFCHENKNFSVDALTPETNEIIQRFLKLQHLSLLLDQVNKRTDRTDAHNQLVKKKLIHAISVQMKIIGDNTLPWYNYNITEKKWIKGIQIESANDLFALPAYKRNNDMDYTGSLKISISTDILKLNGPIPNLTYQNLIYGGEVYTPFFKDTNIFNQQYAYNVNDRPHGCFEYIGVESHGIGRRYNTRWTNQVRVGTIGGRFGHNFQYFLHRDISFSPYPTGWDAQISNPGRLAFQYNFKHEFQFLWKQSNAQDSAFRVVPSGSYEVAAGHFMSYVEVGFNLSTQNFKDRNQDNVMPLVRTYKENEKFQKVRGYLNLAISARGVIHNTMMEGYGVFCTKETDTGSFATASLYKMEYEDLRRVVFFSSFTLGLRFRNINLLYSHQIKSPEFSKNWEGVINIPSDNPDESSKTIQLSKYWHQYATIGLVYAF